MLIYFVDRLITSNESGGADDHLGGHRTADSDHPSAPHRGPHGIRGESIGHAEPLLKRSGSFLAWH